jgi:hypothetical protein
MKKKLIISYEQGYNNWYVSEFYKYFHKKIADNSDIDYQYMSLRELSIKFNKEYDNHQSTIFNWYNLIIYNPVNEKMFVHSWFDYAPEILKYSVNNNFNVIKFSCVSNLNDNIINEYKDKLIVQPSIYYLENWSDIELITSTIKPQIKRNKAYFNGLNHGYRENIMSCLSKNDFFNIRTKINPEHFRQKNEYYSELSNYNYGISLNGAANICYRDLELFALGVLNLRQPLTSKTYNPLVKDVHYIELIDNNLTDKIIFKHGDPNKIINERVEELINFSSTKEYCNMINESKKWFIDNCLPENQYKILLSFFDDFDIFF